MKIKQEENDSIITKSGRATMVIVAITKDDGKTVRCPYSADKSIADLIADVNEKMGSALISTSEERISEFPGKEFARAKGEATANTIREIAGIAFGKIQKEDLVKCVKLLPRIDKYAPIDMVVFNGNPNQGGIYRVLALPTNKVPYYEVIDDTIYHKGEIPRRTPAFPEEIEFFEKRQPPTPKELGKKERFAKCPVCHHQMVEYLMDNDEYKGECENCKMASV